MRTAIITGASAGLGLQCVQALLEIDPSWHMVLAVRDPARGAAATQQRGPGRLRTFPRDVGRLFSR